MNIFHFTLFVAIKPNATNRKGIMNKICNLQFSQNQLLTKVKTRKKIGVVFCNQEELGNDKTKELTLCDQSSNNETIDPNMTFIDNKSPIQIVPDKTCSVEYNQPQLTTVATSSSFSWTAFFFVAGCCVAGYTLATLIGKLIFYSSEETPKDDPSRALKVLRGLKEQDILYMFKKQTITKEEALMFLTVYLKLEPNKAKNLLNSPLFE